MEGFHRNVDLLVTTRIFFHWDDVSDLERTSTLNGGLARNPPEVC